MPPGSLSVLTVTLRVVRAGLKAGNGFGLKTGNALSLRASNDCGLESFDGCCEEDPFFNEHVVKRNRKKKNTIGPIYIARAMFVAILFDIEVNFALPQQ